MNALPPDHPPVKVASADTPHQSFWHDAGRWIGAGILVLTVQAAGAYVIHMVQKEDQPDGAQVAAMMVELAPAPEAPTEEKVAEEAQPETAEAPQDQAEPEPQPEEVTPPEPEPQAVQEPEEVIPDVVEAEKPEVAVPMPVEKPEVKPEPKPEPKKVEKPKPKKAEKAPVTRQAAAPRMDVDAGEKAAANRRGENSASAGVSSAKWSSKLYSHMVRHTRYLKRRMGRDAKGVLQIQIVIDPSGTILSASLAGSSGNPKLDQLALEAAKRASPVPAPPPALAAPRKSVVVPMKFE